MTKIFLLLGGVLVQIGCSASATAHPPTLSLLENPTPSLIQSVTLNGDYDRVDKDLQIYDDHVKALKEAFAKMPANPHDKEWVKLKIDHMYEVDQYMRKYQTVVYDHNYTPEEERYFWKKFESRFAGIDTENTRDLKELLKIYDWFRISVFGVYADERAWLLVQHADLDMDFQKEVLAILTKLYKIGETSPKNYAYLVDRVAASWNDPSQRTLQRYGTQGMCVAPKKWEPIPMEDPAKVDARRKEVGLGPIQEYIDGFKDICK